MSEQAAKKTGRPEKAPEDKLWPVTVKMTLTQKAKYQRMKDGPKRLRDWLDRAKE